MSQHFIPLLREAHAVVTAYDRGATEMRPLCQRTGLPFPIVAEWTKLLRLEIFYEISVGNRHLAVKHSPRLGNYFS